eukprot:UN03243
MNETDNPLLAICLGDIIDGLNKKTKTKTSAKCMKHTLSEFNKLKFEASDPLKLIENVMDHPLNEHCIEGKKENNDFIPRFPFFQNVIGNRRQTAKHGIAQIVT